MKRIVKRVSLTVGLLLLVGITAGALYVYVQCSRFDASVDKVYDIPIRAVARSTDSAVIARGKHLVESVAGCAAKPCHSADLGGGTPIDVGPLGVLVGPNITSANLGAAYSDGQIARLIKHGVKVDGRSVRFMPAQDISWLPDSDVSAIVSYLRTVSPVDRPNNATVIKTLGKVLDRADQIVFDVARRIDHAKSEEVPAPAPTAQYGIFLSRLCTGCHGDHLSGGRIPGSPSSIPTPLNITPDATGLQQWTFDDFEKVLRQAIRRNGKALDPFMPVEEWRNFDDVEIHALWAYLRTLPPMPFGNR
jgi:hypothetical protein